MAENAILEIIAGTVTIDLLQAGIAIGVNEWTPQSPPVLPAMQSSPLTSGSEVSSYKFGNAIETIDFKAGVDGIDQDDVIEMVQDFRRILIQGMNYQVVDWQNSIVYIRARASCETNIRYAVIKTYSLPEDDFPFGQPFFGNSVMDDMVVTIERGDWLGAIPGVGECQQISSTQDWQYVDLWQVNSALPASEVRALIQATDGSLYAGDNGQIWKSTDNGDTWNNTVVGGMGIVQDMIQADNGYLFAIDVGDIHRSTDNGASWPVVSALPTGASSIIQISNGNILVGDTGQILYSTDYGGAWGVLTTDPRNIVTSLMQTAGGDIYAGDLEQILRSRDDGVSWQVISTVFASWIFALLEASDGIIYAFDGGTIWASGNDGDTWEVSTTLPTGAEALLQAANDDLYASDNTAIYISTSNGASWEIDTTIATTRAYSLMQAANGTVYSGDNGNILWKQANTIEMGRSDTCDREVYISNKQNFANLTHVKIDDGGVFSDIFPISSFPQLLLPAVPVVNDAIYFGIDTSLDNSGPFSSLVFDIETGAIATTSYTITWEYYNGAWVALTTTDNTTIVSGRVFKSIGVNSVHWEQPSDWIAVAVDGDTCFWVRARVSALVGTLTPPTQQNRDIYSIVNAFVEADDANIGGDIPALAEFKIYNQSDQDGKSGSAPDLWSNRLLTGLRSLSRGSEFRAFINISDEQNVPGVTVAAGTNAAFGNDVTAPTGRRLVYSALAGDTTFVDRTTITMSSGIVRDYYGRFHVFVRGKQHTGSSGEITMRVQLRTGSGGITYTTPEQIFLGNNDWELLDFDAFTIPAGGRTVKPDDLGDTGVIAIQVKNDSGGAETVYIYDLVLIPTDEWAGDFTDLADIDDSIIGKQDNIRHFLDIDSVRNPKVLGRSLVRLDDANESISANYEFSTNGEVILQANADQRVWVVSAHIGSNDEWLSEPWLGWSVQAYKNQRYLTQRGSR